MDRQLSRDVLARRKEDGGFEFVTALLARPGVPHAAFIEIFRPVGSQQPLAALWAMIFAVGGQPRPCRSVGMQSHDLVLPEPEPPSAQDTAYWHSMAAARQICVVPAGASPKSALHCNKF